MTEGSHDSTPPPAPSASVPGRACRHYRAQNLGPRGDVYDDGSIVDFECLDCGVKWCEVET